MLTLTKAKRKFLSFLIIFSSITSHNTSTSAQTTQYASAYLNKDGSIFIKQNHYDNSATAKAKYTKSMDYILLKCAEFKLKM